MKVDRRKLEQLAEHIVEGEAVDWRHADSVENPESTRSAIQSLRAVESLRGFAVDAATQAPKLEQDAEKTRSPMRLRNDRTGARWGHLEIRETLAGGSQGVVYRAWDPGLELDVALKLECDQLIARDEARRLARIHHNHVVRVYGTAEHDGEVGLWMEFVRGRTLADRMMAEGLMSEDEAIDLGKKLASALAEIHAVNVVHQDVKARNVMREDGGRYVLMDLGCGADLDKGQTEVGGTPYYMAPEVMGSSRPEKRSDIYSLGVLLFHVVTGRFPFEGRDLREIHEQQLTGTPLRLQDLRPELDSRFCQIVEKAMAGDPRKRHSTAGALLADLEAMKGSRLTVERGPLRRRYRQMTSGYLSLSPRSRALTLASLVVLLAGLTYLGIWVGQPARLNLDLQLLRILDDSTEILESGSEIAPGDMLELQLRGSLPCHVYVFGCDESGGVVRLFPLSYADQGNPLAAESLHNLPGTREGTTIGWKMSSTPGKDRLLVVAAPESSSELEAVAERIQELRAPGVVRGRDLGGLRGFDQTEEIPDAAQRVAQAEDIYRALKELAEGLEGASVREYQLVNASRGSAP